MKTLSIVLPAFNEEENIQTTTEVLSQKLDKLIINKEISKDSFLLFVDDGSRDQTWQKIIDQSYKKSNVQGLKLSRNFGHQSALLAGLQEASKYSDFTITMDADLQHDPNAIDDFVKLFNNGHEIVYGVRENRSDETLLKKMFSEVFYLFMSLLGAETIKNHADFRLMSKRAIDNLFTYQESNLFLRGLIPTIGFRNATLKYKQLNRNIGHSKYSLSKMIALALNGITAFSIKPLRIIFFLGIISSLLSFLGIIYTLYSYLNHRTITGWSSIVIAIYFLGGVQLTCLGVIGEYIGKIYTETKRRPNFIIEHRTINS